MKQIIYCALFFAIFLLPTFCVNAEEWSIPIAGNAFQSAPKPGRGGFRRNTLQWKNANDVFSIYFHANKSAELQLKIGISGNKVRSTLRATVGDKTFDVAVNETNGTEQQVIDIGSVKVLAGYVRVDLQGVDRTDETFGKIHELVIASDTKDLSLDFVKNNKGNMFYWGRRGPSVHLRYEVPKDLKIQYGYSEITVPIGGDPIGSYYMANGFGEGYFGIQVNSAKERRVLFSVWSPFKTDNPSDIPKDQRITALGHGVDVQIRKFGNEGSGGQSYLVYPWKAGKTYRFLTEVKPDGEGNTIYTSWFGDKSKNEWRLIARFRRPKTDTHYRGFHSFLESFSPSYGHVERQARYGNVWVCDVAGKWHECTRARFSVDATGRGRHRLDFLGGSEGDSFFLRNCGFFNETGSPGKVFTRKSTESERPKIEFAALPNE